MRTQGAPVIRSATPEDADRICAIYNHYIAHTVITFEEEPLTKQQMAARIEELLATPLPWLVIEQEANVCGYAYAGKWRTRSAYRFSVETSIYLAPHMVQRGLGRSLYEALLQELPALGIHAVIGGIALPNDASVTLHEKLGFKKVAHLEEVGFKLGRWVDVGYWQKTL